MATQFFLASGSRIVVRNSNTSARWHTTSTEITLPDEMATGNCPLTHQPVTIHEFQGFQIFFPATIIRTREVLTDDEIDRAKVMRMQPILFTYDIPDNAIDPDSPADRPRPFPNPSGQLRRFAVRLNLSCWVMNRGDIPQNLIAKMLDAGCNPYTFNFDPQEAEKLIGAAIQTLRREIADAVKRAEDSRKRADEQLQKALEGDEEAEERAAYYERRAEQIQQRIEVLVGDMQAVADRLGINPQAINIDRLATTGRALKTTMAQQARAYRDAAAALAATGTLAGQALAAAAAQDQVPVEVIAGALEEEGKEAEAQALMKAFSGDDTATFPLV